MKPELLVSPEDVARLGALWTDETNQAGPPHVRWFETAKIDDSDRALVVCRRCREQEELIVPPKLKRLRRAWFGLMAEAFAEGHRHWVSWAGGEE